MFALNRFEMFSCDAFRATLYQLMSGDIPFPAYIQQMAGNLRPLVGVSEEANLVMKVRLTIV